MSQIKDRELDRQEEVSVSIGIVSPFLLVKLSTDWMRPTHMKEDNLLDSVY
jgi:hypothetical protein